MVCHQIAGRQNASAFSVMFSNGCNFVGVYNSISRNFKAIVLSVNHNARAQD